MGVAHFFILSRVIGFRLQSYRERIWKIAEPALRAEGLELVEIECLRMKSRWLVRIYIDKPGGVTLDDCQAASNLMGDLLDLHDIPPGSYTLEVSSPGLDRPLVREEDFQKYKGSRVNIKTSEKIEGSRNFHGTLLDFADEGGGKALIVDVDGKIYRIPKDKVLKAHLAYEL